MALEEVSPSAHSVNLSDLGDDNNSLFDFVDVEADPTTATHSTQMDQDINSNDYARQRRELLDLIIRLQAIGLGSELELPQIACIGSQSVGKSSLIESISGVALPRASGTCTRCPIECRLKRSEQAWEATVYLRFESGKSGYTGRTKETQFGSQMTDRSDVQERIRRAQLAILNPTIEPSEFLNAESDALYPSSRSFSQNCVIVVLSGNELSDLNFGPLIHQISSPRRRVAVEIGKGTYYWLNDVVELAEGARTRELPGEFPFAVTEELIMRTLHLWRQPVKDVFGRAERIFVRRLTALVEAHFGQYTHGGLRAVVQKIVLEKLEEFTSFTLNSHYYLDYKEKFLKHYATFRNNRSALGRSLRAKPSPRWEREETVADPLEAALENLRRAGFDNLNRQDLVKLLPADFSHKRRLRSWQVREHTIKVYLSIIDKRFSDTVPLAIDHRYVRGFEKAIQSTLSIVRKRAELNDRKERLEAARMELMEVPGVVAMRERLSKMNCSSDRARLGSRNLSSTTQVAHAHTSSKQKVSSSPSSPVPVQIKYWKSSDLL
ncbi:myxovirus resistance protein [Rhizoctonia solani]|uniref:Myxovirus resistance protein n=1 Tax=Rhizoctonia solani TaxID=456999 RepID=A0A8H8NX45_9AGAM|nr:myxovirus resistance protein [Rhizoctonia solani]QRW19971.1 myxovirus resistance protein [Rhizoctonia solani]